MQAVNPIDKIRKWLDAAEKDRATLNNEVIRLSGEIDRLIAENDRLKKELAAATFNSLPF